MILLATQVFQGFVFSFLLVLTGYTPEIALILLLWSSMGLSLSTSQQFAFWPWAALAWGPAAGAQGRHEKMGLIQGSWFVPMFPCLSWTVLCLCHLHKIVNCMLLFCSLPWGLYQRCLCGPAHPHSHTPAITHVHRGHAVMMPFMGLEGCADGRTV